LIREEKNNVFVIVVVVACFGVVVTIAFVIFVFLQKRNRGSNFSSAPRQLATVVVRTASRRNNESALNENESKSDRQRLSASRARSKHKSSSVGKSENNLSLRNQSQVPQQIKVDDDRSTEVSAVTMPGNLPINEDRRRGATAAPRDNRRATSLSPRRLQTLMEASQVSFVGV